MAVIAVTEFTDCGLSVGLLGEPRAGGAALALWRAAAAGGSSRSASPRTPSSTSTAGTRHHACSARLAAFRRYGMPFLSDAASTGARDRAAPAGRSSPRACSTRRASARCCGRCSSPGSTRRSCSTSPRICASSLEGVDGLDVDAVIAAIDAPADRRPVRGRQGRDAQSRGRPDRLPGQGPPDRRPCALLGAVAGLRARGRPHAGGRRLSDDRGLRRADRQPRPDARARARRRRTPLEALRAFPSGLVTQEVAAIMAHNNMPVDREAAERALIERLGDRRRPPHRPRRRRPLAHRLSRPAR